MEQRGWPRRECIMNCPKIRGTPLHRFPNDDVRRQVWLELLNMEYTSTIIYLCSRHFSPRMMHKRKLKSDAVPDINLEYVGQPKLCLEESASMCFDEDSSTNFDATQTSSPVHFSNKASPSLSQSNVKMVALPKNFKIVPIKNSSSDPLFVPTKELSSENIIKPKFKVVDGRALLCRPQTVKEDFTSTEPTNGKSIVRIESKSPDGNTVRLAIRQQPKKDETFSTRAPLAPLEMRLATRIWQSTSESSKKLPTLHKKQTLPVKPVVSQTLQKKIVSSVDPLSLKVTDKPIISPAGPVRVKNIHDIDNTWKEQAKKVAEQTKNAKILMIEAAQQHFSGKQTSSSFVETNAIVMEDSFEIEVGQNVTIVDKTTQSSTNLIPDLIPDKGSVNMGSSIVLKEKRSTNNLLCNEVLPNNDLLCNEILPNDDDLDDEHLSKSKKNEEINAEIQLINEERFDGTMYPSSCPTSNILLMGVEDFQKISHDSVEDENTTLMSKASQTSSIIKHACGLVKKYSFNERFNLSCFYCSKEFAIWDWEQFINHVSVDHKSQMKAKACSISQDATVKIPKRPPLRSYPHYSLKDLDNLLPNPNIRYVLVQGAVPNTVALMPLQHILDDKKTSLQIVNSVETFYKDVIVNKADSDGESSSINEELFKHNDVIKITKTETTRVTHFLEVLREHPLLWHTRRQGPTIYDIETEKFIQQFDNTMTPINFRASMDNIRHWYRRYTPFTSVTMTKVPEKPKHKEYLKILSEIEELSKRYAFYCDQCEFYFLDIDRLATHKYLKHNVGDLKFACSCGLHFESEKRKNEHELLHKPSQKPSFMCELCGMTFSAKWSFRSHLNRKHAEMIKNPLPFQCTKCDARFPNSHMRSWHELKHAPPRFNCKICGRKYYKLFQYKHHLKKHMNQRDFICEDCGRDFVEKRALIRHRYRMHDIGGYYCEFCNTYYSSYEKMDAHNKSVHPNGTNMERRYTKYKDRKKRSCCSRKPRIFKCKQCGTIFERQYQLMRHKRQLGHNLGERFLKCSKCPSICKSRVALVRHLRTKHESHIKYSDLKEEDYLLPMTDGNSNNFEGSSDVNNECEYAVHTIICSEDENIIVHDVEIQEIFEEFEEELKIGPELSSDHVS